VATSCPRKISTKGDYCSSLRGWHLSDTLLQPIKTSKVKSVKPAIYAPTKQKETPHETKSVLKTTEVQNYAPGRMPKREIDLIQIVLG